MFKFLAKLLSLNKKSLLTTKVVTKKANEVYILEELQKVEQRLTFRLSTNHIVGFPSPLNLTGHM